jgi:hypothetical protein
VVQTINFGTEENPINVKISENHPEYFVDGSVGLAIGFPVSKLVLTSADPHSPHNGPDDRKGVCTVVANTDSLIDMAKMILRAADENRHFLQEHSIKVGKRINESLDTFEWRGED